MVKADVLMRATLTVVVTTLFGLGCVGELLDRERMPVVRIDVQVTGECTWAPSVAWMGSSARGSLPR